ncbi:hypothetical protein AYI81_18410 [Shewanella algae]|nr:hypothetical protein AYI80_17555 [Shewanella algae]TXS84591.1 hypothetical protein AYI81_18410 [Shewanella algae]
MFLIACRREAFLPIVNQHIQQYSLTFGEAIALKELCRHRIATKEPCPTLNDFKWCQRLLRSKVDFEHPMVVITHNRISANVDAEY